jgi:tRNA(Ile)-lysidine synthase TilS/MesJ
MDIMEDNISSRQHSDITRACELALSKIEKYYSRVDSNDIYSYTTLLDTMLKFSWWKEEEWEDFLINEKMEAAKSCWKKFLYEYYQEQSVDYIAHGDHRVDQYDNNYNDITAR